MPPVEDYRRNHPWENPEPHVPPGYTGYLPGYGPKRIYMMAQTYGKMTHDIMHPHSMAGRRLAPILDTSKIQNKIHSEDFKLFTREFETGDLKLRDGMPPGYTGYVPRKMYRYGKSYAPECKEAIAEMTDLQRQSPMREPAFILPDPSLLAKLPETPTLRPYALNENTQVPQYATFEQKKNYGERPMNMGSLNPQKRQMPGYGGYIPGQPNHFEKTYSDATYAGIETTSNALTEYNTLRERPAVGHWYVGRGMKTPEKVHLDGYHSPMVHKVGPVAGAYEKYFRGYGGFVPKYGHKIGVNYGEGAKDFYNHEDLSHSVETFYS